MVRLNKTQLTHTQLTALYKQLDNALGKISSKETTNFLSELLGYEERIMLAKRLAVIVLLVEGKSLYQISELLKVSSATGDTIKRKLIRGDYNHILKILGKSKKDYFAILKVLDEILHLGGILPHYNGLDRYKYIK